MRHLESHGIRRLWEYLLLPPYRATEQKTPQDDFYSALKSAAEWPPDVFCLAAAVLAQFGASAWLTSEKIDHFRGEAIKRAERWESELASSNSSSSKTQTLDVWGKLVAAAGEFTSQAYSSRYYAAVPEVMEILAILLMQADCVCRGFGLPSSPSTGGSELRGTADFILEPEEFGSTLCKAVHPAKARVLPKTHTPPSGRTLRSLSHNLCYVESDEGRPLWYTVPSCVSPLNTMNLLLIPYPPNLWGMFQRSGCIRIDSIESGAPFGIFFPPCRYLRSGRLGNMQSRRRSRAQLFPCSRCSIAGRRFIGSRLPVAEELLRPQERSYSSQD